MVPMTIVEIILNVFRRKKPVERFEPVRTRGQRRADLWKKNHK